MKDIIRKVKKKASTYECMKLHSKQQQNKKYGLKNGKIKKDGYVKREL